MKKLKLITEALERGAYEFGEWEFDPHAAPGNINECQEWCRIWFSRQSLKDQLERISINVTPDGVEWVIQFSAAVHEYQGSIGQSLNWEWENCTAILFGQEGNEIKAKRNEAV